MRMDGEVGSSGMNDRQWAFNLVLATLGYRGETGVCFFLWVGDGEFDSPYSQVNNECQSVCSYC